MCVCVVRVSAHACVCVHTMYTYVCTYVCVQVCTNMGVYISKMYVCGVSCTRHSIAYSLHPLSQAINTTTLNTATMSALTAVSSNISCYNAAFSVINLESISSYANQSMQAVTSAMNEFSSLQMFLQNNMVRMYVRTYVDLCVAPTTYMYVRMYSALLCINAC